MSCNSCNHWTTAAPQEQHDAAKSQGLTQGQTGSIALIPVWDVLWNTTPTEKQKERWEPCNMYLFLKRNTHLKILGKVMPQNQIKKHGCFHGGKVFIMMSLTTSSVPVRLYLICNVEGVVIFRSAPVLCFPSHKHSEVFCKVSQTIQTIFHITKTLSFTLHLYLSYTTTEPIQSQFKQ